MLLVTPGMTFGSDEQTVSGWFSIEYPMLDWTRLPDSPAAASPGDRLHPGRPHDQHHQRLSVCGSAGRAQLPRLLRVAVLTAADGDEARDLLPTDNPYPVYPHWAGPPAEQTLAVPETHAAPNR